MTLPTTQEYERQREFERWLDSNAVLSSIPGDGLEGLPSYFSQSVHAMSLCGHRRPDIHRFDIGERRGKLRARCSCSTGSVQKSRGHRRGTAAPNKRRPASGEMGTGDGEPAAPV